MDAFNFNALGFCLVFFYKNVSFCGCSKFEYLQREYNILRIFEVNEELLIHWTLRLFYGIFYLVAYSML